MTGTMCPHCGQDRDRIPVAGGWSCAGCRSTFMHAPDTTNVHLHVTSTADWHGRQTFTTAWQESSGLVRAQVFNAPVAVQKSAWERMGKTVHITCANGVALPQAKGAA